jgi:MoaA/NifB/PqqE/SkfB family radical SAM enzyme
MIGIGVDEIILSAHGVKKSTYEKFMTGASYEKLHEVLGHLKTITERSGNNRKPSIRINYTVNPDNLKELKDFFEVFGDYCINILQVRPIMDIGGKYRRQITEELLPQYNDTIWILREECRKRHVKLLANTLDASYKEVSNDSDIAELVDTYISPKTAQQLSIEWENCTFQKFRMADRWTSRLLKALFRKSNGQGWMNRSLKYEELTS